MIRTEVNEIYAPMYSTKARYILLYGGRGGGRSYAGVQFFLIQMRSPQYFRGYFMREIFGDIRESLWRDFKDLISDLGIESEFHLNETTMTAQHLFTGNWILSKGFKKSSGNQTAKLKSIAGATHVLIEEADEVSESDFDKADDSLRTTKGEKIQVIMMLNPEDENIWINRRWFTNNIPNKDPNFIAIHSTYRDNVANLSRSFVDKLESYKDVNPEYYKVFTLGEWGGGAKGRVFEDWRAIDQMPEFEPFYGLDFGFTNDPTVLVECMKHNNRAYADELIYETGLTNPDLAEMIIEMGIEGTIHADSAEPKSIEELNRLLRRQRVRVVPAVKGPDSIRAGIAYLKQLEVHATRRSKNIWHETKYYVWHMDKSGRPTNKPKDFMNHAMDAIRYAFSPYIEPKRKARIGAVLQ